MIAMIAKRLAYSALVMLLVAFAAFVVFQFLGDPVQMMLSPQATPADRLALRLRLGLNQSPIVQYVLFLGRALHGDFGISYYSQRNVMAMIAERFPATFELVAVSTLVAIVAGLVFGVYAAIHPGRFSARVLRLFSMIGVSAPQFVIGIVLILIFSVSLGWLPAFGRGDVTSIGGWTTGLLTNSGRASLILPTISLALYEFSFIMRLVTAEMLEVLRTDYVKFARARGLPDRLVHFRHALKNCLMPVATMTGLLVGDLIAFAMVTETVFQWPGLGQLFVEAVARVDRPVIAAYLMIASFAIVSINTVVDIVYIAVDPRLRQTSIAGGAHGT